MAADREGLAAITSAWFNQDKDGMVHISARDAREIHSALTKVKHMQSSTIKLERLLQNEQRKCESLQRQVDAYRNILKKMKIQEPPA